MAALFSVCFILASHTLASAKQSINQITVKNGMNASIAETVSFTIADTKKSIINMTDTIAYANKVTVTLKDTIMARRSDVTDKIANSIKTNAMKSTITDTRDANKARYSASDTIHAMARESDTTLSTMKSAVINIKDAGKVNVTTNTTADETIKAQKSILTDTIHAMARESAIFVTDTMKSAVINVTDARKAAVTDNIPDSMIVTAFEKMPNGSYGLARQRTLYNPYHPEDGDVSDEIHKFLAGYRSGELTSENERFEQRTRNNTKVSVEEEQIE